MGSEGKMNIDKIAERIIKAESVKYPRTPHLPWSEGMSDDDIILDNYDLFEGKDVVVTEKLDGENTTLSFERVHARSLDSKSHPSRNWVKTLWSTMRYDIPENMRICGENIYAKHSIAYDALPSFFLVFAIFDGGTCLSWAETETWCQMFGLHHVPVLYKGKWEQSKIMRCYTGESKCGGLQEGYVVRNASSFPYASFNNNIAKFVRKGHVQTSEHWMLQKMVPNKLIKVEIPE